MTERIRWKHPRYRHELSAVSVIQVYVLKAPKDRSDVSTPALFVLGRKTLIRRVWEFMSELRGFLTQNAAVRERLIVRPLYRGGKMS